MFLDSLSKFTGWEGEGRVLGIWSEFHKIILKLAPDEISAEERGIINGNAIRIINNCKRKLENCGY